MQTSVFFLDRSHLLGWRAGLDFCAQYQIHRSVGEPLLLSVELWKAVHLGAPFTCPHGSGLCPALQVLLVQCLHVWMVPTFQPCCTEKTCACQWRNQCHCCSLQCEVNVASFRENKIPYQRCFGKISSIFAHNILSITSIPEGVVCVSS